MTPDLLKLIQKTLADGKDAAFFMDDKKTYLRYDSISIRLKEDTERGFLGTKKYIPNTYVVEFMLRGYVVHSLESSLLFQLGDTLTLSGLEGCMEFNLTNA